MGKYIPRINLPVEGVEHARWLEEGRLDHESRIEALERLVKTLAQANSVAKPTAQATESVTGVPVPPLRGAVLRGDGRKPLWSREWQGLMPEYFVSLDPAGGFYFVTKVGLSTDSATDRGLSKEILPPVVFADGGLTMLPIEDEIGSVKVHTPIYLYVDVNPSFAGEEFTIYLPPWDNGFGPTAPFYNFKLENIGAFDAVVNIMDTELIYEGTLHPVMGDVDTWTLTPGFSAAWSVRNVLGGGAIAAPAAYWNGSAAVFADDYYQTNVYTP